MGVGFEDKKSVKLCKLRLTGYFQKIMSRRTQKKKTIEKKLCTGPCNESIQDWDCHKSSTLSLHVLVALVVLHKGYQPLFKFRVFQLTLWKWYFVFRNTARELKPIMTGIGILIKKRWLEMGLDIPPSGPSLVYLRIECWKKPPISWMNTGIQS